MQGFLNLNKPFDWTSHDCVARVRKLLHLKRVGHGGTLDPAATGVLPMALGRATRLLQYLPDHKAYQATIRFGVQTTTDDLQGEIINSQPCPALNFPDVTTALAQFQGKITQVPPIYSAIQIDGKRLYDLARQGETVEVPQRKVEIFHTEILHWREGDFPELDIAIVCGGGTYIRAIARDLGAMLETGGTLAALIRTESGGFQLIDSLTLTDLETQLQAGTFQPSVPDVALQHLPSVTLPAIPAQKWCHGQKIPLTVDFSGITRVYNQEACFLGIGKLENDALIPTTVLS
ncbi:tRNA pseudouridine(55) synthase TruB [Umezakia ovalisporum]|uniref:tRNA pseudouridine synthase B n=2 Tax=Umezakia ovalisporum TaxID=75695 RepID=A0AA43H0D8_9CYAN|nr:tRNA pseudouridine(55) synthase TruB [Umezakia ovalisporum]MBI1242750.1 tRNA pseudouridine(55) synthase TruB [Nostoc sp. RI_552]MDH6058434.1 tRNA pseudouridine(55) synthase TruB [Umezakia ovalisporum FSS-43]MDH6065016.1 tRNA pseudouridine(55) synthase TruB [Umezakia ovalisporum FSS-62]MDH6070540.1 tRNA pseudouridine(55) synthase TruB [Umezakia ovalisporum CobakiLakeA]MDH6074306.1 tRNA pseudouridine(55) synthase TruB [Umezakia ovalisporum CS-1034]